MNTNDLNKLYPDDFSWENFQGEAFAMPMEGHLDEYDDKAEAEYLAYLEMIYRTNDD